MARQGYYTQPWRKNLEVYQNFGGGLNTTTSNDNLSVSELTDLTNIDLGERGSLKRRYGMKRYLSSPIPQVRKGQGFFRYYRSDNKLEEIIATNGKLYIRRPKTEDPTTAPTVGQTANANSTLSGGTYIVHYAWVTKGGETLASPKTQFTLDAGMELNVSVPTYPNKDVIKIYVYIGTLDIAPTKQGESTTTSYTQATGLVSGEALPTENHTQDVVELPITNLASFQVDKQIDAVQMEGTMFFSTGTKLVEYDGNEAKVVVPHVPQPLEALYIGTNALATSPDDYMADGVSTVLRIDGVTQDKRYGVVNAKTTFTVYISKPDTMSVEYRWYYREKGEATWVLGRDWGTAKTCEFTPRKETEFELQFWVREVATTVDGVQYIMPSYKVKKTDENAVIDPSTIHNCNRMILHWGRLIMFGDETQPDVMYISHLKNPRYFPTVNSLRFENKEREKLTALVQYRDMIIAFTPNTIQAVYGKSPSDFQRVKLNTGIGCIAPDSAKVMGNYIVFLSKEGVHILKSVGYTESNINVEKIDNQIDNQIKIQENACAYVLDSQYHLCYPDDTKRFRYYYEQRVWTKDFSTKLDFARFYEWDGVLYGQSNTTGHVQQFDKNVWDDDGYVYQDIMETKQFDFGQPYHEKKLKEVHLLMAHFQEVVNIRVYVYADAALVLDPDQSYASVDADGNVVWNVVNEPNLKLDAGTVLGQWEMGESAFGSVDSAIHELRVSGRSRRTKVKMIHEEAKPNQLLGIGYIFKVKKP